VEIVRARGAELFEGERPFRFVLVNAFYLQDEIGYGRVEVAREVLDKCVAMGVRVVRTWAFNDGARANAIQPARGALREDGLRALDRVLVEARARGLRLVLALADYWPAYGGVPQYAAWHALPAAHHFFTDAGARAHYAAHVRALLERRNAIDGVRYGDDPAVLAWELMNEARGDGLDGAGAQLAEWTAWAAGVVRAHARQLVALGDEGFDVECPERDRAFFTRVGGAHAFAPANGISFRKNLAAVDVGTCHLYPESWGWRRGVEVEAGERWIAWHAEAARAAGRPLVVAEFGLANAALARVAGHAPRPLMERRRAYDAWFAAAHAAGAAGIGPWLFHYDDRPDGWDDYAFYKHTPPAPIDRYADLVEKWARKFAAIPAA
jgi:mannan endo-1,4-beta-mannosidase